MKGPDGFVELFLGHSGVEEMVNHLALIWYYVLAMSQVGTMALKKNPNG